ncbi:nucleoside 2-deoxyribosyltransferase [Bradyrhizobium sp. RT10b]|uniref:nucleoside 2-deoxyribosyltransferase n=1 Tax=Bradyrhizobium sp. RT10b TaxID=3156331 RepID=UPI003391366D
MNFQRPYIYLAGPIFGCTEGEAKNWRADFADKLEAEGITGISPLRCEPIVGERYDVAYDDPCFGQPKSILAKNFLDLQRCDMTLAYLPNTEPGKVPSVGTIGELSWAYALRKPVAVVTQDPFLSKHPFISQQPSWPVLSTLDDALRLIVGIFGGYAGGRNV